MALSAPLDIEYQLLQAILFVLIHLLLLHMEKEIQKTVKQVNRDKYELEKELEEPVELDEMELEKYIEFVVREVRKGSKP